MAMALTQSDLWKFVGGTEKACASKDHKLYSSSPVLPGGTAQNLWKAT